MSIKTDAVIIRDEVITGANTALRVGQNLVDIADDLTAKQAAINLNNAKVSYNASAEVAANTAKVGITTQQANDIASNNNKISNVNHPLVEKAVPSNAVFTDTIYDDSDVLKDTDTLSTVTSSNKIITQDDIAAIGGGDMLSSTYDPIINANTAKVGISTAQANDITANNAKVSYDDAAAVAANTAKVSNVDHPLVEKAVPSNAVFTDTDTIYDDSDVLKDGDSLTAVTPSNKLMTQSDVAGLGGGDMLSSAYDPIINANTAKVSNVDHPLVETAVPVGAVFTDTDTIYDDSTIQAEVDLNTAKVSNVDHPLVETAVPSGAVFTDTVYDDTAIQGEVDINTAKVGITTGQAGDIVTNNSKISYTDSAAVAANTAKVTYPSADSSKLGLIEAEATKDTTTTIQTKRPLKTVNGDSLEGSGNIVIAATPAADVVVEDLAVTGTKTINWSSGNTYVFVVTGAVVFSDSNLPSSGTSKIITLHVQGDFALTLPSGWDTNKTGTYDGTVLNTITVEYVAATTPFHKVTIIQ